MEHDGTGAGIPPLDEEEKRRLVLRLVTRLRCAACGQYYDPEDFVMVHRWEDVWVLSTHCRQCNGQCQVAVYMHLGADPEPLQDLMPEEAQVAEQWPQITSDDVLDVHTLLQECEDDMWTLLHG